MKRNPRGLRSVSRLLGAMLTLALYLAVLVAATQVTGERPSPAEPAAAVAAVDVAAAESPALTMAIAAAGIAIAGAWRLTRVARRPRPVPVAVTRRRIATTG